MIRIGQVIDKCKEYGLIITRSRIYPLGKREGFFIRDEKGELNLDQEKFLRWLEHETSPLPENYKSVKELSKKFNVNMNYCYNILNENKECVIKKRGVMYGDEKRFAELVEQYRNRNKINWEK